MPIISINNDKCKHCNTCIRVCPVKAIQHDQANDNIIIDNDRCIACGNCFVQCNTGAIEYQKEIDTVKSFIDSEQTVAAIVAPSIAAEFSDVTDYRNFVGMIRSLGFNFVHEVSFGVDLIAAKYKEYIQKSKGKYYISSFCPPVREYIKKFQPKLIDSLVPLVSPMIATALVIKKIHKNNTKIVYIGPCIGQKLEIQQLGKKSPIDAVLGFYELREMLTAVNMTENTVEFSEFDPPHGYKGSLYPILRGILQAGNIDDNLTDNQIISVEGKAILKKAIDDFSEIPTIKHHINQFYCEGCAMGPLITRKSTRKLQRNTLVTNYSRKRTGLLDKKIWEKNIKTYESLDFTRKFEIDDQRIDLPEKHKIDDVLILLGKDKPMDLDCGSCGYDTCYDFSVDVAKGLTKPEMCVVFSTRNRQEYIQKLQSSNRQLAKTQDALQKSEIKAKEEHEAVKEAMQMTTSVMQKLPSGVVIVDKDLRIIQSNNRFINILGEDARAINDVIPGLQTADLQSLLPFQITNLFKYVLEQNKPIQNKDIALENNLLNISIFAIKRKEIIGAIIRDLHEPAIRQEEVITRVREVIDKNLEMVQKIGFLLGEGASETEQMLNTIIESFAKERKNKEE
ncbi:MAG: [Fe-Fe] hydrogenase large subunit C-terminal domain-containing protein [Bacteroidota bacterium]|nr:[Fe-Fe] hydrogenase large subunit C-terminal domain-containing protein [Bacteroidota bacterium]